jgi:hypothetical protein
VPAKDVVVAAVDGGEDPFVGFAGAVDGFDLSGGEAGEAELGGVSWC